MDREHEAEFEAFVAASGRTLLRTAFLLTGDERDAEDLLQTVLARVAQRWPGLDGSAEAYARRSLINLGKDRWRRRRVRVLEVPMDTAFSDVRSWHAGDALWAVDVREALVRALRGLPRRQREVLVLRYFVDLDEVQTADVLGVTVGTVKSSASRALARLREDLPDGCFDLLVGRAS
jgi:RNA polymerase sigma-70 factor (sigma-E family)